VSRYCIGFEKAPWQLKSSYCAPEHLSEDRTAALFPCLNQQLDKQLQAASPLVSIPLPAAILRTQTSTKKRLKCTLRGCKRAAPHHLDVAIAESRTEFAPVGNSHGEALKDRAKALASAGLWVCESNSSSVLLSFLNCITNCHDISGGYSTSSFLF